MGELFDIDLITSIQELDDGVIMEVLCYQLQNESYTDI